VHRFRDITLCTMYLTACGIDKSSFDKTIEITSYEHFRSIHV